MTKIELISVKMGEKFLEKIKKIEDEFGSSIYFTEWRTVSDKVFQEVCSPIENRTVKMTPESLFSEYKKDPEKRFLFVLIGNNKKDYSRGSLKNIKLVFFVRVMSNVE